MQGGPARREARPAAPRADVREVCGPATSAGAEPPQAPPSTEVSGRRLKMTAMRKGCLSRNEAPRRLDTMTRNGVMVDIAGNQTKRREPKPRGTKCPVHVAVWSRAYTALLPFFRQPIITGLRESENEA